MLASKRSPRVYTSKEIDGKLISYTRQEHEDDPSSKFMPNLAQSHISKQKIMSCRDLRIKVKINFLFRDLRVGSASRD